MEKLALEQARSAIRALDLTPENERIAASHAAAAEFEAAIKRANAERDALGERKRAAKDAPSGAAVADAIMDSPGSLDPQTLVESVDDIERQMAALSAGMGELRRRANDAGNAARAVKADARRKVASALEPLAGSLVDEIRQAANLIVDRFAALQALSVAGGQLFPGQREAEEAARGCGGSGSITGKGYAIDPAIPALLAPLSDMGDAGRLVPVVSRVDGPAHDQFEGPIFLAASSTKKAA